MSVLSDSDLINVLQQSFCGETVAMKRATDVLKTPGRVQSVQLLRLIDEPVTSIDVKTAAAIAFKNMIKENWQTDPSQGGIPAQERSLIKQRLVSLMLAQPAKQIQQTLSAAVGEIAAEDFPSDWVNLVPDLLSQITSPSASFLERDGSLQTLASVVDKYRHAARSPEVLKELKMILTPELTNTHVEIFKWAVAKLVGNQITATS